MADDHPPVAVMWKKLKAIDDVLGSPSEVEAVLEEEGYDTVADYIENTRDAGLDTDNDPDQLRSRVDSLEDRVESAEDHVHSSGKQGKVRSILESANNRRKGGQDVVMLDYEDIRAATGVSKRYAFTLMDDLPEQYPFFADGDDVGQYGSAQINKTDGSRRLAVLCDVAHQHDGVVSKLITESGIEGGEA
jgi:hypothetical protein